MVHLGYNSKKCLGLTLVKILHILFSKNESQGQFEIIGDEKICFINEKTPGYQKILFLR